MSKTESISDEVRLVVALVLFSRACRHALQEFMVIEKLVKTLSKAKLEDIGYGQLANFNSSLASVSRTLKGMKAMSMHFRGIVLSIDSSNQPTDEPV